jgi:hypothetical protein
VNAILLTGWCGTSFAKIACHTLPLLEEYAGRHDLTFCCGNLKGERPPSWGKVLMMHQALQDFDAVVWIDADVVVMDPSRNIIDELRPGSWQALVEHHTECGAVPNCGVWVCTKEMLPTLTDIWNEGRYLDHPWWEQAAILGRMGYVLAEGPRASFDTTTKLYERTTFLESTWNHHPMDTRRIAEPRFVHVTMYADRPAECRRLAAIAQQKHSGESVGPA